jgi:Tol biopolymer transport system component
MDIWIGDADGRTGTDVVRRVPSSIDRLAWAGDRLLYGGFVGGRPTILRITPGDATHEEVIADALTPGTTSDGGTIVFITSSAANDLDSLNLWTADASGRRIARLASRVTASLALVTPDDRSVIYTSLSGGTVSIWTVPLAGGTPAKLADGASAAVSPDGASMAYTALSPKGPALFVCGLPMCTTPRAMGPVDFEAPLNWTPDGRGVAFARDGNIWVQPLTAGAPRQLTRFTDRRPISSFAWSRDGKRLALTRSTVTNDIVLFKGLR